MSGDGVDDNQNKTDVISIFTRPQLLDGLTPCFTLVNNYKMMNILFLPKRILKPFPRHIYSDNVAQTGFLASLTGAYVVLLLALPTLPLFWSPQTQVPASSFVNHDRSPCIMTHHRSPHHYHMFLDAIF